MQKMKVAMAFILGFILLAAHVPPSSAASTALSAKLSKDITSVNSDLNAVASDGKGTYLAVGDKGTILLTKDMFRWQQVVTPVTANLKEIVWNGKQFLAVGDAGTILHSKDGVTWKKQKPITVNWRLSDMLHASLQKDYFKKNKGTNASTPVKIDDIIFRDVIWDGWRYAAVVMFGTNFNNSYGGWVDAIATSKDGESWTFKPIKAVSRSGAPYPHVSMEEIAVFNGGYVLGGYEAVVYSKDLTQFTVNDTIRGEIKDVTCHAKMCVAVGFDPNLFEESGEKFRLTGVVYASNNGLDWKEIKHEKDFYLTDLEWAKENHDHNGFTYLDLGSVVWGDDRFVAGGLYGMTIYSKSGTDWFMSPNILEKAMTIGHTYHPMMYERYVGRNADINDMIWDGKQFVAVGNGGTILTSFDAADWSLSLPYSKPFTVTRDGSMLRISTANDMSDLNVLLDKIGSSDIKVRSLEASAYIQETSDTISGNRYMFSFLRQKSNAFIPLKDWRSALNASVDETISNSYYSDIPKEEVAAIKKRLKVQSIIIDDTDARIKAFMEKYGKWLK